MPEHRARLSRGNRRGLGKNQRYLLAQMAGVSSAMVVPDRITEVLVRRGLLAAEPDGSFAHITPAGLRAVADEIEAGRVKMFCAADLKKA